MRMLKTKVRPIATGARWAGAAGNRGARLLGPKDGAPRSRGGDGLDETIGQSLFHDLPLTAHIARDPGISRVLLGPKIRRFLASVCEKPRTTVCYITSYYKMFYAKWRLTTNAGERLALRLPDVKPPCSNLAGAFGSGRLLFWLSQPLRVPASRRRGEAIPGPRP
jgi:hypothetical protein